MMPGLALTPHFSVDTSTLALSGYQALIAFTLLRDGEPCAKTTDPTEAARWSQGEPITRKLRFMCHACWSFQPPYPDERLGLAGLGGYCERCTTVFVARCLRKHGRLPEIPFEFWCRRCTHIRPKRLLYHERGVKRMICLPCRQVIQRRANLRFRAKRRRIGSVASR